MMTELVANLKTAMASRIEHSDWMSADTKKAALEKLAKMDVMVGYPDKWRDYSEAEDRRRPISTATCSARTSSSGNTSCRISASRWIG